LSFTPSFAFRRYSFLQLLLSAFEALGETCLVRILGFGEVRLRLGIALFAMDS